LGEHKLKKEPSEWEQKRDRLKTLWVVAVVVFWVTCGVQLVMYLINGRIGFVLGSIILGTMILGVALKIRLQLHLRKGPKQGG